MQLTSLLRALVSRADVPATKSFSTSFTNVTEGNHIQLQWDPVDPAMYPLAISVRLINRTDNGMANGMQMGLTNLIASSNLTWASPPFPLPYFESALYALEIRPSKWNATEAAPVLVKSDFFAISRKQQTKATGSSPNPATNSSTANGNTNTSGGQTGPNTVAIAVGLAVGIPVIIAAGFLFHLLRKRRQRVQAEILKKRKAELVIE